MSRLRNNKQNKSFMPTITLTPLIDTVLVLLIVFMVTAPCKVITLPANNSKKSQSAQKARADDYRVSYLYVANDGTIAVNGAIHNHKSIIKMMPELVHQSPIKTVFIKSEDSSTSASVINALVTAVHRIPGARVIVS